MILQFLNGRLYLQTSEGLRPGKITFSQDDREQSENVTRVSVKSSDKFCAAAAPQTLPTRRRRKSSKNDSGNEELKQSTGVKGKDEEAEAGRKGRRGVKSPEKSLDRRKPPVIGTACTTVNLTSGGGLPLNESPTAEQKKPSLFNISSYVADYANVSPEKSFAESSSSTQSSPSPNKSTVSSSEYEEKKIKCIEWN